MFSFFRDQNALKKPFDMKRHLLGIFPMRVVAETIQQDGFRMLQRSGKGATMVRPR